VDILLRNPGPADTCRIWEVAMAASAAPGYFDRMEIDGQRYLDGGLGVNNPSMEAYWEVRSMYDSYQRGHQPGSVDSSSANQASSPDGVTSSANPKRPPMTQLVSIGTGHQPFPREYSLGFKGLFGSLKTIKSIATDSVKTHEDVLRISRNNLEFQYFRFNEPGALSHLRLDE